MRKRSPAKARKPKPKKKPAKTRNRSSPAVRTAKPKPRTFESCERPLDDPSAWPPRHDQVQCRAYHEGLTPPAREPVPHPLPEVRAANQEAFLAAFASLGSIRAACRVTGVGRTSVYTWRDEDPEFSKRFGRARDEYADLVDDEMHERGIVGWDEPWVGRTGQFEDGVVTFVRKKSDPVLLKLAAGVRPEKYATKRHEVTGKDGAPLYDLGKLSDDELDVFERLLVKMGARTAAEKESFEQQEIP